jgi:hypothetical protein
LIENLLCLAEVLWRSARPSQVAISVSRAVIAKIATQIRAVCIHCHVTKPVVHRAA